MALLRPLFGDDAAVLSERDFQVLLLANVLPPLGNGLLAPVLDSLIAPFGTTPANVGLLISSFTAPAIVVIPVAGVLADSYGRRPVLIGALVLFGAAGSAIALTNDFGVALALRLLQGVAFGGLTPIIITSIGDIYESTAEATAQGMRFTGSGFVLTAFPLISGTLVGIGWQYPFALYLIAFPAAVAVYLWFEEPTAESRDGRPDGQPTAGNPERGDPPDATDGVDQARTHGGWRSQLRGLAELVGQRRVFVLVVGRSLPNAVWIGFFTYNSIVVVRIMGATPAAAGGVVAVGSLAFATAASQAGRVTHRFESRLLPLVLANVCLGAGFGAFLFAPSVVLGAVAIAVSGVGFGLLLALYRSVVTGLADQRLRGSLVSLAESLGRLSATVTPVAMGAAIGVLAPLVGLETAVQLSGLGVALAGSVGGIACLYVASASPQVRQPGRA